MGIIVGGPHAWKVERAGDLVRAFHYVNGEPAMVLFPVRKRLGAGAFIIPMSSAHLWANASGYPSRHAVEKAFTAATVMAMDTTKPTIHGIVTAVLDGIQDLIRMPPEPPAPKKKLAAIGEMTFKESGKVIARQEVEEPAPSMMIDTPGQSIH